MEQTREPQKRNYEPIVKSTGVTPAERYLGDLCDSTFLSLWSYPGVFRDDGKPATSGHGKEIADLLVVFGEHIIIFSDKHCEFSNTGNLQLDWQRWFRKAIQKSAQQAWGAERWIRQNSTRIFLNRECTRPFPFPLPKTDTLKFHLIVVGHGISERIEQEYGGSGSLMINTAIKSINAHNEPFYVGDLDSQKTFVHVLDDHSLLTLMETRDTISDFVEYLSKREALFRHSTAIVATGEEELLALYLVNFNENGEHDFVLPRNSDGNLTFAVIPEGQWQAFQNSPERLKQLQHDKISYLWDDLIERFSFHALRGDQHFVTRGGIKDAEKILHFMAREPRWKRRYFSKLLSEMLKNTPPEYRNLSVLPGQQIDDPYYVFVLFPRPNASSVSYEDYREVRLNYLGECCKIVRLEYPAAKVIVGLATESGTKVEGRSEDVIYFDARQWTPTLESEARERQKLLRILQKPTQQHLDMAEYPS